MRCTRISIHRSKIIVNNKLPLAILTSLALLAWTNVITAQSAVLEYSQVVAETRRIERLEGSEYFVSKNILFKPVRLNLKSFGGKSEALYVSKRDEVGFVCTPALRNFTSGWVEGRIEKLEPGGDGGHFFTLSGCRRMDESKPRSVAIK